MPSLIFSSSEAVALGQLILTAYDIFTHDDSPVPQLADGYSTVTKIYADDVTDDTAEYQVFGFIAKSATDVVVAIRGTQGLLEWFQDAFFSPKPFPYVRDSGSTEQGFTQFYSTFRTGPDPAAPRVADALAKLFTDPNLTTLRIAGHSLGGALATLLAIDVAGNGIFKTPVVYTFGSPAVGDKIFAGVYDGFVENSFRVVNLNDVVPKLLPVWSGYTHVDSEVPINSDDRSRHNWSCWHSINTYLNILDPTVELLPTCKTAT